MVLGIGISGAVFTTMMARHVDMTTPLERSGVAFPVDEATGEVRNERP